MEEYARLAMEEKERQIFKYNEFRNNVMCRNLSNQIEADKLWKNIKHIVPENDRKLFEIEWGHYMINEFNTDTFASYFDLYVKKYFIY